MNKTLKILPFILLAYIPYVSHGEEFIVFGPSEYSDSTTSIIWMEQSPKGIIVVTREENEVAPSDELFGIPSNIVQVEAPSIAITWILSERTESLIDRNLIGLTRIFHEG